MCDYDIATVVCYVVVGCYGRDATVAKGCIPIDMSTSMCTCQRISYSYERVNGPCLLDYLILKLRLPVILYVSFAVDSR